MASKKSYCPKCGKYITNNDTCMFCHIVPKTYQKKWSKAGTETTVYYFDKSLRPVTKDDKNYNPYSPTNGGNVKNFMGEWDYYILTEEDQKEINGAPRCIENYFSKEIENLWSGVYELFIEGNVGKDKPKVKREISKSIYAAWKEQIPKGTVSAFSQSDFAEFVIEFNELDKFIWMQHFRRFENMYPYLIEAYQMYHQPYNCFSNEFIRTCYLKSLNDCVENVSGNLLQTVALAKDITFSPVAIFATDNTKFILSDNPVVYNMGSRFDKSLGGGLYMAISPDVLIAYLDLSKWREKQPEMKKDDLIVVAGTDDFIQYYNKLLLDRSYTKVGFNSTDIKNHIASDLSKNHSFNEMLGIDVSENNR